VFRFRSTAKRLTRVPWLASAGLHGLIIALAVGLSRDVRPSEQHTFITLEPLPRYHRMPAYGGTTHRARPSGGVVKAAAPPAAALAAVAAPFAPAPAARVDSTPKPGVAAVAAVAAAALAGGASASAANAASAAAPAAGAAPRGASVRKPSGASAAAVAAAAFPRSASDARIWVGPRPSLPKDVAEALYLPKDTVHPDTVVTRRLRALVDSMNHLLDLAERDHKAPSWTTDIGGMKFGIDSANIYIAGLKIPTPVLALFGSALPQGNFDEAMRDKQMADIRRDMMQAAQRAKTMEEFNHYVRELRTRKQAEHDAARAQRDSTHHTGPDTVRVIQ